MKKDHFVLEIRFRGQPREIPVTISEISGHTKISAFVNGKEITFRQDEYRDGLRPVQADNDIDPELCYLIGKEISDGRQY